MSVDRKVFPGYGFAAVPECKNCIFARSQPPAMQKYNFCTPPEAFRSTECNIPFEKTVSRWLYLNIWWQIKSVDPNIPLPRREGRPYQRIWTTTKYFIQRNRSAKAGRSGLSPKR
jgi:hypothetical protein